MTSLGPIRASFCAVRDAGGQENLELNVSCSYLKKSVNKVQKIISSIIHFMMMGRIYDLQEHRWEEIRGLEGLHTQFRYHSPLAFSHLLWFAIQGVYWENRLEHKVLKCCLRIGIYRIQKLFFSVIYFITKDGMCRFNKEFYAGQVLLQTCFIYIYLGYKRMPCGDFLVCHAQNHSKVSTEEVKGEAKRWYTALSEAKSLSKEERQELLKVETTMEKKLLKWTGKGICWGMVMSLSSWYCKENNISWKKQLKLYCLEANAQVVGLQVMHESIVDSALICEYKGLFLKILVENVLNVQNKYERSIFVREEDFPTLRRKVSELCARIKKVPVGDIRYLRVPKHIMILKKERKGISLFDPNVGLLRCSDRKVHTLLQQLLSKYNDSDENRQTQAL